MTFATTYDTIETIDTDSSALMLPVSSKASTTPVTGARTTDENMPAMPRAMKLMMNMSCMPVTFERTLP